jgi:chloramphenicol O-acetyltransferase
MLTFWLTTYLLCLVDVFFNRHHTCRCKLCSSSRQRIPVFVWGRFHTGSSQGKRTEASPIHVQSKHKVCHSFVHETQLDQLL